MCKVPTNDIDAMFKGWIPGDLDGGACGCHNAQVGRWVWWPRRTHHHVI